MEARQRCRYFGKRRWPRNRTTVSGKEQSAETGTPLNLHQNHYLFLTGRLNLLGIDGLATGESRAARPNRYLKTTGSMIPSQLRRHRCVGKPPALPGGCGATVDTVLRSAKNQQQEPSLTLGRASPGRLR